MNSDFRGGPHFARHRRKPRAIGSTSCALCKMPNDVAVCAGIVVLITSIVLFICSFGYVGELQYCLKYHTISRVVRSSP